MHQATVEKLTHSHTRVKNFSANESRTLLVVLLTSLTMVIEIVAGYWTGSMALLADGWHMGTHTLALGLSYVAYRLAYYFEESGRFSFGTGKMGVLAGYTSALFLGSAAIWMIYESIGRIINPVLIAYSEAIGITFIGLVVNLASVLILNSSKSEHHHHSHDGINTHHHDHNYRAAYLHVIADSLTSFLALIALFSGRYFGWMALDPIMGIVGGLLISRWAYTLMKSTSSILLDGETGEDTRKKFYDLIESDKDSRLIDLHVWHIGSNEIACIASIVTSQNLTAEDYKTRIKKHFRFHHTSVEIHFC
ncbi:MAG: CDF family Co(II)/Ni(II) efflux transporter DmeF [Desulfobacterales bacterium]|nr:CDF family Co(II)/Ni(II) efflux transporter DmeF [Desulfobacterales bacterium]